MTDKVKLLLNDLNSRNYRSARTPCDSISDSLEERISKDAPLLFENDDFGFNRSLAIKLGHGPGNVSPDYYSVLNKGFDLILISRFLKISEHPLNMKLRASGARQGCVQLSP